MVQGRYWKAVQESLSAVEEAWGMPHILDYEERDSGCRSASQGRSGRCSHREDCSRRRTVGEANPSCWRYSCFDQISVSDHSKQILEGHWLPQHSSEEVIAFSLLAKLMHIDSLLDST